MKEQMKNLEFEIQFNYKNIMENISRQAEQNRQDLIEDLTSFKDQLLEQYNYA